MVTQSQCSGLEQSDTGLQETQFPITALKPYSKTLCCEFIKAEGLTLEVSLLPTYDSSFGWAPQEHGFSLLTPICHTDEQGTQPEVITVSLEEHSSLNHVFPWGLNFLGLFSLLLL